MPRSRSKSRQKQREPQATQDSQTATHTNEERSNNIMSELMQELSEEQVAELLAGARSRGSGDDFLRAFLDAGISSTEVSLASGPFAGKTAEQAATSIKNAKVRVNKETGQLAHPDAAQIVVRVLKGKNDGDPGRVFVIDKAKVSA